MPAFKYDLRRDAGAIAGGDGIFAETVAIAKQQKRFFAKIAERDRGAARQTMLFGERGEERFCEQWERLKFVAANGQSEDGDVDGAGPEAFEEKRSDFFDHDDGGRVEFGRPWRMTS